MLISVFLKVLDSLEEFLDKITQNDNEKIKRKTNK